MASELDTVAQDTVNKLRLLSSLLAQPGDLALDDKEKAGLTNMFNDMVITLQTVLDSQ